MNTPEFLKYRIQKFIQFNNKKLGRSWRFTQN